MSTRVYVPSSIRRLQDLLVSGGLGPLPILAHAVTQELREALREVGEEEWEYDALMAAAQDSLGVMGEEDRPLRVVIVAEAESVTPVEDGEESLVEVDTVIPLTAVVAVHVDSEDAADTVAEAQKVLERCLDHDLGWYATQEIPELVRGP